MRAMLQRPAWWLGGLVLALAVLLFFVPPGHLRIFPPCLFHRFTGLHCPGCGATRAAQELLRGNLHAAWRDNALFVLALPVLAWFGWWRWRRWKVALSVTPLCFWSGLVVLALFAVWRNLPSGAWLSPAVP